MEHNRRPINRHVRSPRALQPIQTCLKQRRLSFRIRPLKTPTSRIARIIKLRRIAITAKEKHIRPPIRTYETRRFNERTIACVTVQQGHRISDGRIAIVSGDLLQHERRTMRAISVPAGTAAAEAVAVDFVHDVDAAICVDEASGVDGAAGLEVTGDGGGGGGVGPGDVRGGGGADAVLALGRIGSGGEVEDEEIVFELEDVGGPDGGVAGWCPGWYGWHGVLEFSSWILH